MLDRVNHTQRFRKWQGPGRVVLKPARHVGVPDRLRRGIWLPLDSMGYLNPLVNR